MNRDAFTKIENHMLNQMKDSAHDRFHIYRVLYSALDIAETEENVDRDILIAACLLHDIGRERQFENLELCHAQIGGEMAFDYLMENNWNAARAAHVKQCIASHRYRKNNTPESIEAKILFDADKLDAAGALGIARTLIYEGKVSEPLYIFENGALLLDGGGAEISSFFQEYNYKLKNVYGAFYTERARQIAHEREKTAINFYEGLLAEVTQNHKQGQEILEKSLA